jgi:hypothetical protein
MPNARAELTDWVVLYVDLDYTILPQAFRCQAEDLEHAEEQCNDAYPSANIVWVENTSDADATFSSYWGLGGE